MRGGLLSAASIVSVLPWSHSFLRTNKPAVHLSKLGREYDSESAARVPRRPCRPSYLPQWSTNSDSVTDPNEAKLKAEKPSIDGNEGRYWKWRGHDIYAEARRRSSSSEGPAKATAILIHGFAASTTYWRATMGALGAAGYEVHALDLLGQGRSSKPAAMGEKNVEYSINLWAQMIDDYAREQQLGAEGGGVILVGNSLGSLVALSAATGDFQNGGGSAYLAAPNQPDNTPLIKGICLFNCAIGLNSRNLIKNPSFSALERAFYNLVFDAFNALIFNNKSLLRYLLNNVVTQSLLRDALRSLYPHDPNRVDDQLVDSFLNPALSNVEGAIESISQIYTNDAGLTPMELHQKHAAVLDVTPIHLIWGEADVVTPIRGDVGMFYCDRVANNRGSFNSNPEGADRGVGRGPIGSGKGMTTLDIVKGGHIPFDDNPEESHDKMFKWLDKVLKRG